MCFVVQDSKLRNLNGEVMVTVFVSNVIDQGFEPQSGERSIRSKKKVCLAQTQDNMSQVERHVHIHKSNEACWSNTKRTSSSRRFVARSRHDIANKKSLILALHNNHPLAPKSIVYVIIILSPQLFFRFFSIFFIFICK